MLVDGCSVVDAVRVEGGGEGVGVGVVWREDGEAVVDGLSGVEKDDNEEEVKESCSVVGEVEVIVVEGGVVGGGVEGSMAHFSLSANCTTFMTHSKYCT